MPAPACFLEPLGRSCCKLAGLRPARASHACVLPPTASPRQPPRASWTPPRQLLQARRAPTTADAASRRDALHHRCRMLAGTPFSAAPVCCPRCPSQELHARPGATHKLCRKLARARPTQMPQARGSPPTCAPRAFWTPSTAAAAKRPGLRPQPMLQAGARPRNTGTTNVRAPAHDSRAHAHGNLRSMMELL